MSGRNEADEVVQQPTDATMLIRRNMTATTVFQIAWDRDQRRRQTWMTVRLPGMSVSNVDCPGMTHGGRIWLGKTCLFGWI